MPNFWTPEAKPHIDDIRHALPYGLEIARQLADANKTLYLADIALRWDAAFPIGSSYALEPYVEFFVSFGALRRLQQEIFLPRRRQRECHYHHELCLPTRENAEHHALAYAEYEHSMPGGHCPTFLVDLLDPWPRGYGITPTKKARATVIPDALRHFILERDNYRCQLCGASPTNNPEIYVTIDHKVSQAHGGTNDPANLWVLCNLCNSGKGLQDSHRERISQ